MHIQLAPNAVWAADGAGLFCRALRKGEERGNPVPFAAGWAQVNPNLLELSAGLAAQSRE